MWQVRGDYISTQVLFEKVKNTVIGLSSEIYPYLKSHLGIVLLVALVVGANFFVGQANASYNVKDMVYLDPAKTTITINAISPYTPTIHEQANDVKVALQTEKDDEYIQKTVAINTEGTKLETNYTVQDGDTLTTIADKFGLHVATIVDRNGINTDGLESITSGQNLVIPSKDTSDSTNWLAQLNEKKEAEAAAAEAERQQQIALANSRAVATRSSSDTRSTSSSTYTSGASLGSYSGNNSYPYGWCTWYAASRRNVPGNWGNAGQWLGSAQAAGYATGSYPQPGALLITYESWYGHVAYVESVNGDSFTVSEMNYAGWGVVSSRSINVNSGIIKGFIY